MHENIIIANYHAAIGGIVVAAIVFDAIWHHHRTMSIYLAIALLLVHPAWSVSAVGGDCGWFKRYASYAFTACFVTLLICQYVSSRWRSHRSH